jgi:hypothetical protein
MNIIVQILLIIFVVLWTARLARNKGRNVALWAGLAAIPAVGLIEGIENGITALCMFPMLALIFVPSRRPVTDTEQEDSTVACPRCQHSHEPGPSFCTNCGWELTKPYANTDTPPSPADAADPSAVSGSQGETPPAEITTEPGAIIPEKTPVTPVVEPAFASTQTGVADPETASQSNTGPPSVAEPPAGFAVEPLTISLSLTAAGMTERGLALFNQGRAREAVDQFTKAIALDPRYREAWANRAKAYSELGLKEKAAADRQQLEAI